MPHAENGVILPCTHHFDQPIKSTNRVSYRRLKTLFSALEKPMDNPFSPTAWSIRLISRIILTGVTQRARLSLPSRFKSSGRIICTCSIRWRNCDSGGTTDFLVRLISSFSKMLTSSRLARSPVQSCLQVDPECLYLYRQGAKQQNWQQPDEDRSATRAPDGWGRPCRDPGDSAGVVHSSRSRSSPVPIIRSSMNQPGIPK